MKRSDLVAAGAERLFALEDAVDMAMSEAGELLATLTRLRVTSNISGTFGQKALDAIMAGAAALNAARAHFVGAHGHLDIVKTQLGCKATMIGTLQPKPNSDGVTTENTPEI